MARAILKVIPHKLSMVRPYEEVRKTFDTLEKAPFDHRGETLSCACYTDVESALVRGKGQLTRRIVAEPRDANQTLKPADPKYQNVGWTYHTAVLTKAVIDGKRQDVVLDHALFDKPVLKREWLAKVKGELGDNVNVWVDHQSWFNEPVSRVSRLEEALKNVHVERRNPSQ